eukprot:g19158.t1
MVTVVAGTEPELPEGARLADAAEAFATHYAAVERSPEGTEEFARPSSPTSDDVHAEGEVQDPALPLQHPASEDWENWAVTSNQDQMLTETVSQATWTFKESGSQLTASQGLFTSFEEAWGRLAFKPQEMSGLARAALPHRCRCMSGIELTTVSAPDIERRPSKLAVGRCWRCGQEIQAELEAVEAHEEVCSRPMQQLLDAAELLAPGEPGDSEVPGGTEASGASGATSPTSSSLLSQAYRAAGYGGKPETPLTPSMDPVEVYGRIEDTVETLVLLLLDPVLKGIPSLGILPARVEARRSAGIPKQIFETPGRCTEAADDPAGARAAEAAASQECGWIEGVTRLVLTVRALYEDEAHGFRAWDPKKRSFEPWELLPAVPSIVEGGANDGIHVAKFLDHWPKAQIFAFEPDPTCFQLLVRNVGGRLIRAGGAHSKLHASALAGTKGTRRLKVRAGNHSKSAEYLTENFPEITWDQQYVNVQGVTLDSLFDTDQRLKKVGEHGTAAAAVAALRAQAEAEDSECGMSQRLVRKVSELLVMRFLPVVGAGAFLRPSAATIAACRRRYTIYSRLRLAALVAEMNGHNAEDPEVQGLLFFCILPGGEQSPSDAETETATASPSGRSKPVALRAARGLGHGLARQVLQRSTGWRSASDLYDLAAAICSEREPGEACGPQTCTVQRAQLLFQVSKTRHPAGGAQSVHAIPCVVYSGGLQLNVL